jgi:hypothetical protein
MFKLTTILTILSKIRDFIGKEKLYDWAKPTVIKLVRDTIDFKDDEVEESVEDIIIATADMLLEFALGLPIGFISEKEKEEMKNKKQLQP